MGFKSVLPPGWYLDLLNRADLEASYRALNGVKHFSAEALRGRIRSFQLRLDDAWEHFEKATRAADKARETIPNLVRKFLLHVYVCENALLSHPIDRTVSVPYMTMPELPRAVFKRFPEVRYVVDARLSAEAALRLHLGDYHTSSMLFMSLVEAHGAKPDAALALHYSGLAAAQYNLGLTDESRRNIENAALALRSGGSVLNRVKAAGILHALQLFLEEPQEAVDWLEFLKRIECPEATKEAFLARGKMMLERSTSQHCLLVI